MKSSLYFNFQKAKDNDTDSTLYIVETFIPLIKKYSRKLNFDGADTDLIISLLNLIKSLPDHLTDDNAIVSYIAVSIKNEYIKLSKRNNKIMKTEILFDEYIKEFPFSNDEESLLILNELLDKLPKNQSELLKGIFIDGYSVVSIAKKLNISRQAVNKTKNIALKQLRTQLEM